MKHSTDSISQIVDNVFTQELGIVPDIVTDDLTYGDVPEWDSNSHLIMVTALEEKFDLNFDDDDIVEFTSIGKIKAGVASKLAQSDV